MIDENALVQTFREIFSRDPEITARAPGRVNLIGEHVDYNGGFVLPAAIDREVRIVAARSPDRATCLYSVRYGETWESTTSPAPEVGSWQSYYLAVAEQFSARGHAVPSLCIAVDGDVPPGSGLSSSAAYEVCSAMMLDALLETHMSRPGIALLAQAAEHSDFVGVKCGIMDQYASACAEAGHALWLDCHTVTHRLVPFDPGSAAIVIINSMKKRGLVDSEYNRRREECERGIELLREAGGEQYPSLRHVPREVFDEAAPGLPAAVRQRVRHNITENERVTAFCDALRTKDMARAGRLLYASHESLRNDFEVSCRELDQIVEAARATDGVYGCRMTGAGFGGCAVALVEKQNAAKIAAKLAAGYEERSGLAPEWYVTEPSAGASARTPARA